MKRIILCFVIGLSIALGNCSVFAASFTQEQYQLAEEMFETHMNYFLSEDAVTRYGIPLTAYKVGDRGRYGYSNPTEWGYLLQSYVAMAERGLLSNEGASERIKTSLATMRALQTTPGQNHNGLFYLFYKVTEPTGPDTGMDVFPYHDDQGGTMYKVSSIDNGLLYSSLRIVEGWSEKIGDPDLGGRASEISGAMSFREFLFTSGEKTYIAHTVDAKTGQI
jgi:hypothetical protein